MKGSGEHSGAVQHKGLKVRSSSGADVIMKKQIGEGSFSKVY